MVMQVTAKVDGKMKVFDLEKVTWAEVNFLIEKIFPSNKQISDTVEIFKGNPPADAFMNLCVSHFDYIKKWQTKINMNLDVEGIQFDPKVQNQILANLLFYFELEKLYSITDPVDGANNLISQVSNKTDTDQRIKITYNDQFCSRQVTELTWEDARRIDRVIFGGDGECIEAYNFEGTTWTPESFLQDSLNAKPVKEWLDRQQMSGNDLTNLNNKLLMQHMAFYAELAEKAPLQANISNTIAVSAAANQNIDFKYQSYSDDDVEKVVWDDRNAADKADKELDALISNNKLDLGIESNRLYWQGKVHFRGGVEVKDKDGNLFTDKTGKPIKVPHAIVKIYDSVKVWQNAGLNENEINEAAKFVIKKLNTAVVDANSRYVFFKPTWFGVRDSETQNTYNQIQELHLKM